MRRALNLCLLTALAAGGCNDDDDDRPPATSGGWGWIRIETPSSGPWTTTAAETVTLGGSAFIRSENGGPIAEVTWWNLTTGQSGVASSHFAYDWVCFLWYCEWAEVSHTWSAAIPLVWGDNAISVEARTNANNWAQAWITVTRVPDTTPPTVWISTPASTVTTPTVTLEGTAWDDVGVAGVTVQNQTTGATAQAVGTTSWTVVMTLDPGLNVLKATAADASGLTSSAWVEITFAP